MLFVFLLLCIDCNAKEMKKSFERDVFIVKYEYGIDIKYKYSRDNFPKKWLKKPTLGKGTQMSDQEISRMLSLTNEFLFNYSKKCIETNLKSIVLLNNLSFYGKRYGGTSSKDSIYITSRGKIKQNSKIYTLGVMHAEFSSILFKKYKFPKKKWHLINKINFKYIGKGRDMLGQKSLNKNNEELLNDGFLAKYGQSSLENDFNRFAIWLFTKPNELSELAKKYPKIKEKRTLAMTFYKLNCEIKKNEDR